jgi:hypothetical protein
VRRKREASCAAGVSTRRTPCRRRSVPLPQQYDEGVAALEPRIGARDESYPRRRDHRGHAAGGLGGLDDRRGPAELPRPESQGEAAHRRALRGLLRPGRAQGSAGQRGHEDPELRARGDALVHVDGAARVPRGARSEDVGGRALRAGRAPPHEDRPHPPRLGRGRPVGGGLPLLHARLAHGAGQAGVPLRGRDSGLGAPAAPSADRASVGCSPSTGQRALATSASSSSTCASRPASRAKERGCERSSATRSFARCFIVFAPSSSQRS